MRLRCGWAAVFVGFLLLVLPAPVQGSGGLSDLRHFDALPSPEGFYTAMGASGVGEVFVLDQGEDRVLRYGRDGRLARAWSVPDPGPNLFQSSLAVSAEGAVYLLERRAGLVRRYGREGDRQAEWALATTFGNPEAIAVGAAGEVVVRYSQGSQHFTKQGRLLRTVGGPASNSVSVALDEAGTEWSVVPGQDDRGGPAGGFVFGVDRKGRQRNILGEASGVSTARIGAGRFGSNTGPAGLAVDRANGLWVSDPDQARLQRFDVRTGNATVTCGVPTDEVSSNAKVSVGDFGQALYYLSARRVLRYSIAPREAGLCREAPFRVEDADVRVRRRASRDVVDLTFRATRRGRIALEVYRVRPGDCRESGRIEGCAAHRRLVRTELRLRAGRQTIRLRPRTRVQRPDRYAIRFSATDTSGNISGTRVIRTAAPRR